MVDLHAHLLFDTDDGVETINQSINKIKEANKNGIDTICLTPHYIEEEYINKKEENYKKLEILKEELKKQKIDTKLYLGNEIYISEKINENLENNIISKIGNSDYVLIELPRNNEIIYLEEILNNLLEKDIKIIIAHPERYSYVQKNYKYFDNIVKNKKIYLQGNYGSVLGYYGKCAKETILKLIKYKKLDLLSSDIHNNDIYLKIPEMNNILKSITEKEYIFQLIEENPNRIINNENIVFRQKSKKIFKFLQ